MIFFLGSSNWFSDALCVLADLVFFYVPMYMLGPRLEPILTALLILAHMVLPIVHGAAFYVVYSYYKTPRIILPADAGNVGDFYSGPPLLTIHRCSSFLFSGGDRFTIASPRCQQMKTNK